MHDIRAIRENPEHYVAGWRSRGLSEAEARKVVEEALALDRELRAAQTAGQEALARRNAASKAIGAAMGKKDMAEAERLKAEVEGLKGEIAAQEAVEAEKGRALRDRDPAEFQKRSSASMARHCAAMVEFQRRGSIVFDYGNNLRQRAYDAGVSDAFSYPGFVPAYVRPLFCEGKGPFRWVALSGDPEDIRVTDEAVLELFPEDAHLHRWVRMAQERVQFQGLPARICWLGYGERHRAGLRFNELVASGAVKAPIVIGRDHLDAGSVASPNRETEGMRDGSDAIADWAVLNALINTAAGATWVSFHHGGGVGIGYSLHAGQVIVADGSPAAAARLERVLTADPGMGVVRHVDAGYERAVEVARERGVKVPMMGERGD